MAIKLLLSVLLIKIVVAIKLEVNIDENRNVQVSHEGSETSIVTDEDIDLFNIGDENLKSAVEQYFGKRPADVFVRSPTPWGDLYKSYNWEPVKRVLSVKSANVTNIVAVPVIVMTHDTENPSNKTITVNTGLSRKVENTLTKSWSEEKENVFSQDIEYGISVGYVKVGGKTGFSFTTTLGKSETKTESETIGTTSNLEVKLKPGTAIRAVLTASAGHIEIEVVHTASLTGHVVLNYNPPYRGHHFHKLPIQHLQNFGVIKKEITMTETIKMECYGEAKLKVFDLETNKTVNEKPVDRTTLTGLLTKFNYMNMFVMLFCITCKKCLALCDDFF